MDTYGSLTSVTNSTRIDRVANTPHVTNGVITQTITCSWDDKDTHTPSLNSEHPENSNYTLQAATQERIPGDLCKITLTYATDFDELPDTTVVEQSSQEQVDIREHPNFGDWSAEWDAEAEAFLPSSSKYGISSYIKGTTTVTVTEYFASKPASRRNDIGTLDSPSVDYGSAENWLIIASTRQQQGTFWTRQTTYLWSAKPWNADIYGS